MFCLVFDASLTDDPPGLMKLSGVPIDSLVKHLAVDIAKRKAGVAILVWLLWYSSMVRSISCWENS